MTSCVHFRLVTRSARACRYFAASAPHLSVTVYQGTQLAPHSNLFTCTGCSALIERAKCAYEAK